MNRSGWCRPCTEFASRYPGTGPCGACGRQQPLKKGHCRLCWCRARLDRPETTPRQHQNLLPWAQRVRCHQLFFAGMPGPRDLAVRGVPRCGVRATRLAGGPPAAAGGRDGCLQLPLFADASRVYRYGRIDLRTDAVPGNPWLARALHIAHTTAGARGWDSQMLATLNRTLAVVLSGYAEGTMIKVSEFRPALRQRGDSITRTAQILDAMGILADDRPAAFDQWLAARLGGLAPGISGEASRWAVALHDGTPRTPPLHDKTVRSYVAALRPALLEWSACHGHLRDIARDDVRAVTAALHGPRRQTTLVAARSLFAWARKNGVIFRDPASRLQVGRTGHAIFQPLLPGQIDQAVEAATTPHARVFVALAAVHAARPAQIRALQLSDADLGNRRLTIAGRTGRWTTSPTRSCSTGSPAGRHAGRIPPIRTCSSAAGPLPEPGPSATHGCGACAGSRPPWTGCASTGSSRKPSPAAPTRCTSPWCSASTTPPPSATPPRPGNSWHGLTRPAPLYPPPR